MSFWTDPKFKEPLRQHRWYLKFNDADLDVYTFALKECKKPEYEINITEHRLLTHTIKFPGLLKWKPIDVKIASVVSTSADGKIVGSVNETVENFVSKFGYNDPNFSHQEIQKNNIGVNFELYQIDEDGKRLELWLIYNPLIASVTYGNLSYENEGIMDVSLNINYDYAKLIK